MNLSLLSCVPSTQMSSSDLGLWIVLQNDHIIYGCLELNFDVCGLVPWVLFLEDLLISSQFSRYLINLFSFHSRGENFLITSSTDIQQELRWAVQWELSKCFEHSRQSTITLMKPGHRNSPRKPYSCEGPSGDDFSLICPRGLISLWASQWPLRRRSTGLRVPSAATEQREGKRPRRGLNPWPAPH